MRYFKPQRADFIPKGAIKITPRDVDAEVYVYEREGRVYALGFGGKRQKPDFHTYYSSPHRRERNVRDYLDNLRKVKAYRDEQQAKRRGFKHGYKVGDVLHYSWGYEQTQCDFFEVVATTDHTVTIREIGQETVLDSTYQHGMADMRVATPGKFLEKSEPLVKRVQYDAEGPGYVSMPHGCASLWDGRPRYCSWYA